MPPGLQIATAADAVADAAARPSRHCRRKRRRQSRQSRPRGRLRRRALRPHGDQQGHKRSRRSGAPASVSAVSPPLVDTGRGAAMPADRREGVRAMRMRMREDRCGRLRDGGSGTEGQGRRVRNGG